MKEKAKQIRGDSGGGLVLMDKKGKGKKWERAVNLEPYIIYVLQRKLFSCQDEPVLNTWIAHCYKLSLDRRLFITF